MKESGFYPAGAEFDKNAPYNETSNDNEPIEIAVEYSVILRKKTTISTTDYVVDEWEECERDEEGNLVRYGEREINYDSVDLAEEYDRQHYSPMQLIHLLKSEMLRNLREHPECRGAKEGTWQHIVDECCYWEEDDEIVE